jgi:hypothetical protein
MRRRLLLGCVVVLLVTMLPGAAEALNDPNGDWTQVDNGRWPDPGYNMACNPCLRWAKNVSGTWEYALAGRWPGVYQSISQWAVASWSGQQYKSPYFSQGPNSDRCLGAGVDLCVTATTNMPDDWCGAANHAYNPDTNLITFSNAYFHSGKTYTNGPNSTTTNSAACDARKVMLHEVGHSYSEGHSARGWALMFSKDNEKEKIDGLAKAELDAVYGGLSTGCPCPSVNLQALKAKALATAEALYAQLQAEAEAVGDEPATAP